MGDKVTEGQLISELDYTSLVISKQESQANYDVATENLNKLLAGATGEDRALSQATVIQAESAYNSAMSELERVKASAAETIAQAEKTLNDLLSFESDNVTPSEQSVMTASSNLDNMKSTYSQAITNTRDSVLTIAGDKTSTANSALDAVNTIISDDDIDEYLSVKDPSYLTYAKSYYSLGLTQKSTASDKINTAKINPSNENVISAISNTKKLLEYTLLALKNTFDVLDNSVTTSGLTKTNIETHKTTINTHITTINTAASSLESYEQAYNDALLNYNIKVQAAESALSEAKTVYDNAVISAENALNTAKITAEQQITVSESKVMATKEAMEVAKAQRDQVVAPANVHDVALARAKIRQAQAALDSVNKRIEDSQIKAPFDGIITAVEFEVGELVSQGQKVISMVGEGGYEIDVHISEADIAKVKVSDVVKVTLDAFGEDEIFMGKVSFIEPAETVIQDVIYYLVKVNFESTNNEIKSGMTANVNITTNQKSNILSVTSRAIIDRNGDGKWIKLLINNQAVERKIILGIRGDEGYTEIIDGLQEGDVVITQTIEN
ncbi:hypothetical protein C0583_02145 [Candidatus Parcubacteria bacterium]|nr:MAG: hypothetical protein C0583_02145 [Candidatus Parcubacteria bacterium]